MPSINRAKFKQDLLSNGIEMTDQEINNYINLKLNTASSPNFMDEDELTNDINNVVTTWEDGDRAQRHNNPGAHKKCRKQTRTDFYYLIMPNTKIYDSFKFDYSFAFGLDKEKKNMVLKGEILLKILKV